MTVRFSRSLYGAPNVIRTHDTRFRKPLLYPAELWTQSFRFFVSENREKTENFHVQYIINVPFLHLFVILALDAALNFL